MYSKFTNVSVDSSEERLNSKRLQHESVLIQILESLILAQDERWRRA